MDNRWLGRLSIRLDYRVYGLDKADRERIISMHLTFMGKDLQEMSRPELIKAVVILLRISQRECKEHFRQREFLFDLLKTKGGGKNMSSHFLRCPNKNQYTHINVCRKKCAKHDHCDAREKHEIKVMLDAEAHEMILNRLKAMEK